MTKKAQKQKVPKQKIADVIESTNVPISTVEQKVFGLSGLKKDGTRESALNSNPYVVLRYFQKGWECFSAWEKDELTLFSGFLEKLSGHTWESVYKTAGKGENKSGLGYTPYELSTMKSGKSHLENIKNQVSSEIGFFELRLSSKVRVHGFQYQSAFFLVLLDREHRVFS